MILCCCTDSTVAREQQPHGLTAVLLPRVKTDTARVQMFWPSGEGIGKRVTIGAFVTDLVLCQNYFETIFTRLPKKIVDDVAAYLTEQGLPCEALGNGGQGGPDRRGGDDGRARPASVKVGISRLWWAHDRCWACETMGQAVFSSPSH